MSESLLTLGDGMNCTFMNSSPSEEEQNSQMSFPEFSETQ